MTMDDEDIEFTIAHNRKYSNAHLWFIDQEETLKIGLSEFLLVMDTGAVLRVNLPDQGQEIDEGDVLFSIRSEYEAVRFVAPFSLRVVEVNGELESTPETINDSPYDDGWVMIIEPHDDTEDALLTHEEYIEYLQEA
jgi:glycine cleavage system H protein